MSDFFIGLYGLLHTPAPGENFYYQSFYEINGWLLFAGTFTLLLVYYFLFVQYKPKNASILTYVLFLLANAVFSIVSVLLVYQLWTDQLGFVPSLLSFIIVNAFYSSILFFSFSLIVKLFSPNGKHVPF